MHAIENWFIVCHFGQVVILLFMYYISLCVLFSAYCIVLISLLAMREWCIPVMAIQSSYLIIWWLLLYTITCCGLINWINGQDILIFLLNDSSFLLFVVVHLGAVRKLPRTSCERKLLRRRVVANVFAFPVRLIRRLDRLIIQSTVTSTNTCA